jgi:hypothetical protein
VLIGKGLQSHRNASREPGIAGCRRGATFASYTIARRVSGKLLAFGARGPYNPATGNEGVSRFVSRRFWLFRGAGRARYLVLLKRNLEGEKLSESNAAEE